MTAPNVAPVDRAPATRVALIGLGKMGRAVRDAAAAREVPIVAQLDRDDVVDARTLAGADVAVEFTEPDAAVANARACLAAGCAVVVGTTGWHDRLPALADDVRSVGGRLLWAPNFSVGVSVFLALADAAARLASAHGFATHLIETHHAAKRDAPSGTALAIADVVQSAVGGQLDVTSVRVGHVPGTHELLFDAPHEQLRIVHEARDRRVFADGALTAALWLARRRAPGVYTMRDVISLGGEGHTPNPGGAT